MTSQVKVILGVNATIPGPGFGSLVKTYVAIGRRILTRTEPISFPERTRRNWEACLLSNSHGCYNFCLLQFMKWFILTLLLASLLLFSMCGPPQGRMVHMPRKIRKRKVKRDQKEYSTWTAVKLNGKIGTIRLANGLRQLSFGGIEAKTIIISIF